MAEREQYSDCVNMRVGSKTKLKVFLKDLEDIRFADDDIDICVDLPKENKVIKKYIIQNAENMEEAQFDVETGKVYLTFKVNSIIINLNIF